MERTEIRVIYGDTDQMGVVYYANYLRFFEAGRNEFLRAKGLRYAELEERHARRLPVAQAGVTYRQPARYDDLLAVETSLVKLRRASARFEYRLVREDGALLATGFTVHGCVDPMGSLKRLPPEWVERLCVGEAPARAGGG